MRQREVEGSVHKKLRVCICARTRACVGLCMCVAALSITYFS